jgi:hypothetical protein
MIAFCGASCSDCPAFIATQADDRGTLEEGLTRWRAYLDATHFTLADMVCDVCHTGGGRLNGYRRQYSIRACAKDRGVPTGAHGEEHACAELGRPLTRCHRQEGVFDFSRNARSTLDAIRADLVT